jgi:hypothetical protein
VHVRACHWLEHGCGDYGVMLCFRGFAKSTLLAEYNAWRYYRDATYRILHQGADDQMAYKTSRDVQKVLRTHPWCRGLLANRPGPVEQWWVDGSDDERNASFFAKGITSTTTSSRADECQNDDVEVPKNITNPENRSKMRDRLGEQVHIMVPGARHIFIGTPHTHDSLYDEHIRLGANVLKIQMFEQEYRIDTANEAIYELPFVPEIVFSGIHEHARLLAVGDDYVMRGQRIVFRKPPNGLVDFYAGCAWPERFNEAELLKRRRKVRTINAWDSQYQLHSKPLGLTRLDPDRMQPYDVEPVLRRSYDGIALYLGNSRIVGVSCRWDPSSGKLNSDISSLAVVFQDGRGRRYWHRDIALTGDLATFDDKGERIKSGQVLQIVEVVRSLHLPRVTIETNGIGKFAPNALRAAFLQAKPPVRCAVVEDNETKNKNKRILEAVEPVLTSNMLWVHTSVLEGDAPEIMREWNPQVTDQVDDPIDALAGAITEAPERINAATAGKIFPFVGDDNWRPRTVVGDVAIEDA